MTNEELKAFLKAKFPVEGEMLDNLAKRIIKVYENSLYSQSKKKQLEENIEKVLESNSRGEVKDYSLVLSENKDKREFYLQGYIELK